MAQKEKHIPHTRDEMLDFFNQQKDIFRALKLERNQTSDRVSGVVVADKIAQSIRDEQVISVVTPELGRELSNSVQRHLKEKDDVEILTVSPIEKLPKGKLIIISLPGNAISLTNAKENPVEEKITKSAAQDGVESFLKFIENDVQINRSECEFVACYYSHKNNELIESYNQNGIYHAGIEKFATLFDDLISQNGRRIDAEQATKNMKNVVLRGQCFGTLVISELEQCLHYKLAALGYSQKECIQILSAPTALMSSSPVNIERQPQYFNVFAYANCSDTLIPTINGSTKYQNIAGFTDEELKSQKPLLKVVQYRKNMKLILCSHLDFPETSEMEKFVAKRLKRPNEQKIHQHVLNILKGHAFSAVTNPIKKSAFMKQLHDTVMHGMSSGVGQAVTNYRLQKLGKPLKHFNINVDQLIEGSIKTPNNPTDVALKTKDLRSK